MSVTLQAPQEPEDPASQGCLCLPPVHGGVVRPQAQPVATAEGGHLLAEEEEKGVEAERGTHSPDVGQVHGGLHLQRKGSMERGKARGGSQNVPPGQMEPPRRPRRSSLSASHRDTLPLQDPQRASGSLQGGRLWHFLASKGFIEHLLWNKHVSPSSSEREGSGGTEAELPVKVHLLRMNLKFCTQLQPERTSEKISLTPSRGC